MGLNFANLFGRFRNQYAIKKGVEESRQLNYFAILFIYGLGFTNICFYITLWRKSEAVNELVNYYDMSVGRSKFGVQPYKKVKEIRNNLIKFNPKVIQLHMICRKTSD